MDTKGENAPEFTNSTGEQLIKSGEGSATLKSQTLISDGSIILWIINVVISGESASLWKGDCTSAIIF